MNRFDTLSDIIRKRRSIKPATMNGEKIEQDVIWQLLQLADWAPTHGNTEPWRFVVFEGNAVQQFCADHAMLYRQHTDPAQFVTASFDKFLHLGDKASHIIAVYMKRGNLPKIPVEEELAAAAAAIQNLLLGAEAMGLASFWSTGGLTHHAAMKKYFGLDEMDQLMGLLYLGYAAGSSRPGMRVVALAEKVKWHNE